MPSDPDARLVMYVVMGVVCAVALFFWYRQEWRASRALRRPAAPPKVAVVPDFVQLFVDGGRRSLADSAGGRILGDGGDRTITVKRIAELELPTGVIVVGDPIIASLQEHVERRLPPGRYAVDACVTHRIDGDADPRVAALRIVVAQGVPVSFEPAGSYGVDTGMGCVMDASTALELEKVLADERASNALVNQFTGDWRDYRVASDRPDNCVMVHSGWGDGIYESYWGLAADGSPAWFVTNFEVVV